MILRSLRVEGCRCFANPVQVGRFSDGLNILYGPNGVGKSTLLLALVRAMFDSHKVGGERALALKPWGRELSPTVHVEFEHEGQSYRLQKRFLASQLAELSRLENGSYVRLAQGEAADTAVRRILAAQAPSKASATIGIGDLPRCCGRAARRVGHSRILDRYSSSHSKVAGRAAFAGEDAGAIEPQDLRDLFLPCSLPRASSRAARKRPVS